jgi:hypothetical protein
MLERPRRVVGLRSGIGAKYRLWGYVPRLPRNGFRGFWGGFGQADETVMGLWILYPITPQ